MVVSAREAVGTADFVSLALRDEATVARYWMTFLVFSVFPAPDSPVQRIDWSSLSYAVVLEPFITHLS